MTLEQLTVLKEGDKVVFIQVDDLIREYHNHQIGDEMIFLDISDTVVNFLRNSYTISHFSYDICKYIELKVVLERQQKLDRLGI